jgi:hypothetical protein
MARGCAEANPIVARVGLLPMKIVSTVALTAATRLMPKHALHLALGALVVHSAVAASNLHQAQINTGR